MNQQFELQEPYVDDYTRRRLAARRKLIVISCLVIGAIILILVLGLSLGLRNSKHKSDECAHSAAEVYANLFSSCKNVSCMNTTFLDELNGACQTTTTQSTLTTTFTSTLTTTLSSTASTATTSTPARPVINYRLPTDLVPYHYDLEFKIQFDKLINNNSYPYDGEVTMYITCVKDTSTLVFHFNNIDIDNETLTIKSDTDQTFGEIKGLSWRHDLERQFFIADLPKQLKANNNYTVNVKFTGYLKDDNDGFYWSSYKDDNQKTRLLMVSQMAPTDARKAFPCYDEPALKATFKLSVSHHQDFYPLSNTQVASKEELEKDQVRYSFEPTPKMSSYLVTLIVSDFKCINGTAPEAGPSGDLRIQVCARPNAANQLDYALNVAIQSIEFYEKLYEIKYPLTKFDNVAIPDFKFGAMENWGIITYRESRLLFTPGVTSTKAEQSMVIVIAHEVAHQWFGNIVSPEWWNDVWLNEGFARYMEFVGTAHIKPEWEMDEELVELTFNIQQQDSVASSHPISVEVNDPDEINEIFDDITYGKGGSVIRMANYFLGNDTFYRGVNKYLKKYVYSNAIEEFLWETFDEVAKNESKLSENLSVTNIMNTWTRQMGHPVVTIKIVDSETISLTQNHFLLDQSSKPVASAYNYTWYIPFTHTIEKIGEENEHALLITPNSLWQNVTWILPNETTKMIKLSEPLKSDEFILANIQVSGFYRINYDDENWNRIIRQLGTKKEAIPTRNRAQLINDAFSFSQAKLIDVIKPFEIIKYMSNETEYLPWRTLIDRLSYLIDMLDTTSVYGKFNNYLIDLIKPLYEKLGWEEKESDSWLQKQLRINMLAFACGRGMPECVTKAKDFYAKWVTEGKDDIIPGNYRTLVYCTAIREGGEKEWNHAAEQYLVETDSNQKSELQSGMSCTRIGWLMSRFLNDQLDKEKVRPQDALSGIRAAATKSEGNLRAWNFVKDNWPELFTRYGTKSQFPSLIADLTSRFNTQQQLNDFDQFFEQQYPNQGSATREVQLSRDRIKANIKWMTSSVSEITKWLNDNSY